MQGNAIDHQKCHKAETHRRYALLKNGCRLPGATLAAITASGWNLGAANFTNFFLHVVELRGISCSGIIKTVEALSRGFRDKAPVKVWRLRPRGRIVFLMPEVLLRG